MLTDNNATHDCQANENAISEAFSRLNFLPSRRVVYDHLKNTAADKAPRVIDMSLAIGLSDRAIYVAMRELEAHGFIRRQRVGKFNTYSVCGMGEWKL